MGIGTYSEYSGVLCGAVEDNRPTSRYYERPIRISMSPRPICRFPAEHLGRHSWELPHSPINNPDCGSEIWRKGSHVFVLRQTTTGAFEVSDLETHEIDSTWATRELAIKQRLDDYQPYRGSDEAFVQETMLEEGDLGSRDDD